MLWPQKAPDQLFAIIQQSPYQDVAVIAVVGGLRVGAGLSVGVISPRVAKSGRDWPLLVDFAHRKFRKNLERRVVRPV